MIPIGVFLKIIDGDKVFWYESVSNEDEEPVGFDFIIYHLFVGSGLMKYDSSFLQTENLVLCF